MTVLTIINIAIIFAVVFWAIVAFLSLWRKRKENDRAFAELKRLLENHPLTKYGRKISRR